MEHALYPALLLPADQQARLRLTSDQRERMAPVLFEEYEQLHGLRRELSDTPSRRDRFFLICEARWIREEADNEIENFLTDAQQRIWEDIRDERRAELRDQFQRHADFPHSRPPFAD